MSNVQDLTLAGLVHDLKNVFETINEAAELLSSDARWGSLAAAIERSVKQGSRITASLQESVDTFDLEMIVDNAIQCTRDFLMAGQHPEVHFVKRCEPGMRLAGRPGAWERVLVNLFLNSAKAMPNGGEVEITACRTRAELEIVVSDNGPGIPPEILGQVFTPGFSTRRSHSGLGLSIVESIVRSHGGNVRAGNRQGISGATFVIAAPDPAGSVMENAPAYAGHAPRPDEDDD